MGRRKFLSFGVSLGVGAVGVGFGAVGLAGCTGDRLPGPDRPDPSAAIPPTPTPTQLPGTVESATRETDLAIFAATALRRFRGELTIAQRHLLVCLRDAHRGHAAVLGRVDPLAPDGSTTTPNPTTPATPAGTPTPTTDASAGRPSVGHSPKAALAELRTLESRATKAYAALAESAAGPEDQQAGLVLLWGSLAAASAGYLTACRHGTDPGPGVIGDHRLNVIIPDQQTAVANLLRQCYAIIFGYQSAIAQLSGDRVDTASTRLAGYRDLRDRLAAQLDDQQARVPAAAAAYRLAVQPTSAGRAARLIAIMETRMLPFLGQWLATVDKADRSATLATMIRTADHTVEWSPKITVWPGYPTR
ncbi:DUF4439 domain-containing protein [Microlunatus sp. Gsoil 973]|uniref:DUF4439 domain-containing protein n=1 Tax=Microlunatus sp. Gsoil 973 TaxID=2672569 RepID=UPI0018A7FF4D|nr:DUF4439 domain-containing protein [Microlunatus sp. Gsoil 973]